jgi:hypothetical protein
LLPARRVRVLESDFYVVWTGFTTRAPQAAGAVGEVPTAILEAQGPLALLANPNLKISPPPLHHARTGAVIHAILDAAGWPPANRIVDVGDAIINHWFVQDIGALEALQQIADAEGGFLREGTNWDIVFESRYHRYDAERSLVSQATLSDTTGALLGYSELALDEEEVYNRAEVVVTEYVEDPETSELWRLEPITLQPGEIRLVIAQYPEEIAFVEGATVTTKIVTPLTLTANATLAEVPRARGVEYTLTNTHLTLALQVELRLTGHATRKVSEQLVRRDDLVSLGKYGLRTFPFTSPWFNAAYADSQALWALATYKEPHPVLQTGFPPIDPDMLYFVTQREVSDRISLVATSWQTQFGITGDFYIESVSVRLASRAVPMYSLTLSPAEADPGWGRFDVSTFDTSMRLAW